ncbi:hypothetical protein ACFLZI_03935, partial [Nitrospirota bacterium]
RTLLGTLYIIRNSASAEILYTTLQDLKVRSYIYSYLEGKFSLLWQDDVFARIIEGKLYTQRSEPFKGYSGSVTRHNWPVEGSGENIMLPPGADIYSFALIEASGNGNPYVLTFDLEGYPSLYGDGLSVWRGEDSFGGAEHAYKKATSSQLDTEEEEWFVNDRTLVRGASILAIKRVRSVRMSRSFGSKSTTIMALYRDGRVIKEVPIVQYKGGTLDFTYHGDRLYTLRPSFGVNLMNVFKGKKVFKTKLLVYSLKGR